MKMMPVNLKKQNRSKGSENDACQPPSADDLFEAKRR